MYEYVSVIAEEWFTIIAKPESYEHLHLALAHRTV